MGGVGERGGVGRGRSEEGRDGEREWRGGKREGEGEGGVRRGRGGEREGWGEGGGGSTNTQLCTHNTVYCS